MKKWNEQAGKSESYGEAEELLSNQRKKDSLCQALKAHQEETERREMKQRNVVKPSTGHEEVYHAAEEASHLTQIRSQCHMWWRV